MDGGKSERTKPVWMSAKFSEILTLNPKPTPPMLIATLLGFRLEHVNPFKGCDAFHLQLQVPSPLLVALQEAADEIEAACASRSTEEELKH